MVRNFLCVAEAKPIAGRRLTGKDQSKARKDELRVRELFSTQMRIPPNKRQTNCSNSEEYMGVRELMICLQKQPLGNQPRDPRNSGNLHPGSIPFQLAGKECILYLKSKWITAHCF